MKVLLIDDDKNICSIYTEGLLSNGIEVDCANTYDEGEKKVSGVYDALILDMVLDEHKNGIGLLKQFERFNPRSKKLVVTGYGEFLPGYEDELRRNNVDKWWDKGGLHINDLIRYLQENNNHKSTWVPDDTGIIKLKREVKKHDVTINEIKQRCAKHGAEIDAMKKNIEEVRSDTNQTYIIVNDIQKSLASLPWKIIAAMGVIGTIITVVAGLT